LILVETIYSSHHQLRKLPSILVLQDKDILAIQLHRAASNTKLLLTMYREHSCGQLAVPQCRRCNATADAAGTTNTITGQTSLFCLALTATMLQRAKSSLKKCSSNSTV
jgi:hypothetical protein